MQETEEHSPDSDCPETALVTGQTNRTGGKIWKVFACLLFLTSGVLGWFLYETSANLKSSRRSLSYANSEIYALRSENSGLSDQVFDLERDLRTVRSENENLSGRLDRASRQLEIANSSLSELEFAFDQSRISGRNLSEQVDQVIGQLTGCRDQLDEYETIASGWQARATRLEVDLEECVAIANERLRKINAAISTANSGMLYLTDIPSSGFFPSYGDPYDSLRRKYNDLVDRFNAAVERSNDLGELLNRSLRQLN